MYESKVTVGSRYFCRIAKAMVYFPRSLLLLLKRKIVTIYREGLIVLKTQTFQQKKKKGPEISYRNLLVSTWWAKRAVVKETIDLI